MGREVISKLPTLWGGVGWRGHGEEPDFVGREV